MPASPSTRQHLDDHLGQAEFALQVAANFACLMDTPAHANVRSALAQVASARAWVKTSLVVETTEVKLPLPPVGQGIPLTRAERMGYRWP